ncbi:hypothetical protein [Zobellella sp. An-6]|uniref:hypothetical protein n=1 Tax=Zobellella sp. An-6 TaxID=3400218 RepID=UPI004042A4BD
MATQTLILQVTPGISQASVQDLTRLRNDALTAEQQAATHAGHANLAAAQAQDHAQAAAQSASAAIPAAATATDKAGDAADAATIATAARDTAVNAAATATAKAEEAAAFAYAAALEPAPGQVPLADEDGKISLQWLGPEVAARIMMDDIRFNDIGTPGELGFGVGICPRLPPGYAPLPGTFIRGHAEYGNYQYRDGSIMVWIPAFYYRMGHPDNPTYAALEDYYWQHQSVHILPLHAFASRAEAAMDGYALHRAFVDGGIVRPGFMLDKYQASNNNGVASAIADAIPLRCQSWDDGLNNQLSTLNGAPPDTLAGIFEAAQTRGSAFFPASRFMRSALGMLSLAHGQAGLDQAHPAANAWNTNMVQYLYPKGNNNYLQDQDDHQANQGSGSWVQYAPAGADGLGKTGSGTPFARTTHNGQACGVADLNGNLKTFEPGITCVTREQDIAGLTFGPGNVIRLTVTGHGLADNATVQPAYTGRSELDGRLFAITVLDADTIELNDTDYLVPGSYAYPGGGRLISGQCYVLKESTAMEMVNGGNSSPFDYWGEDGIGNLMQPLAVPFNTVPRENGMYQYFVQLGEPAFSPDTEGDGWRLAGLGFPQAGRLSNMGGAAPFGSDLFYQCLTHDMAPLSGGCFWSVAEAGIWAVEMWHGRSDTDNDAGFRAASYPLHDINGTIVDA